MLQLISHFGVQFYLFELQGTLTYEYTKIGKPPKQYQISDEDLDDDSDGVTGDTEGVLLHRSGIDASAVGIQLRLTKNDGLLRMKLEGRHGTTAEWVFEGLHATDTGRIVASTGTQTHINPKTCVLCGNEKAKPTMLRHCASQTDVVAVKCVRFSAEAAMQTARGTKSETPDRTTSEKKSRLPQPFKSDVEMLKKLKRKASLTSNTHAPVHKRAKNKLNSKPWPRTMYMECDRLHPSRKGDGTGLLIVDIENGTVWYEDSYGKAHARTIERKQVDIKSASSTYTDPALL